MENNSFVILSRQRLFYCQWVNKPQEQLNQNRKFWFNCISPICIHQFLSAWSVCLKGSAVLRLDALSRVFSPEATEPRPKWAAKVNQEGEKKRDGWRKHQSNPLLNDVSFLYTYTCKVELSLSFSYPIGPLLLLSHIHLAKLQSKTLSVSLSFPN